MRPVKTNLVTRPYKLAACFEQAKLGRKIGPSRRIMMLPYGMVAAMPHWMSHGLADDMAGKKQGWAPHCMPVKVIARNSGVMSDSGCECLSNRNCSPSE